MGASDPSLEDKQCYTSLTLLFSSFREQEAEHDLLVLNLSCALHIFRRPRNLSLSICVGNSEIAQREPFSALIPFSLDCFVDSSALSCSTYTENKSQVPQQITMKALEKKSGIWLFGFLFLLVSFE